MTNTVNGFDIPLRQLSEEELNREITLERFNEFHGTAGEDFLDRTGEGDVLIYAGWMLHKYPGLGTEILTLANAGSSDITEFHELEELTGVDAYINFAEFCNQTSALKKRVNQVLIQVTEHYND